MPLLSRGATLYTSRELIKDLGSNLQLFSCKHSYCRHLRAATIYRLHQNFHYNTQVSESCRCYPMLTICSRISSGFRKAAELNKAEKYWFSSGGLKFPSLGFSLELLFLSIQRYEFSHLFIMESEKWCLQYYHVLVRLYPAHVAWHFGTCTSLQK